MLNLYCSLLYAINVYICIYIHILIPHLKLYEYKCWFIDFTIEVFLYYIKFIFII